MPTGSEPQSDVFNQSRVHLEPWGQDDLALLKKLLGDPEMTKHLGGPEQGVTLFKLVFAQEDCNVQNGW